MSPLGLALLGATLASEPPPLAPDSYGQGLLDGEADARSLDWVRPAAGGCAGSVAGGAVMLAFGVCGVPLGVAVTVTPVIRYAQTPPAPPLSADWSTRPADYRNGYVQGYQDAAGSRAALAALGGGLVGATVMTGVFLGVLAAGGTVFGFYAPARAE
ncbi:hypothetical protein L6R46_22735 [Myxococcota bacterium]|nr:hypothetical protein [Myxococcota bacterium]